MVRTMDPTSVSLTACPHCAAQMPETAAFCPGCGLPMQAEQRAQGKVGIFSEPIAGALAYLTFIPAVVFLVVAPYKTNRFVRFHSFQCLLLWAVSHPVRDCAQTGGPFALYHPSGWTALCGAAFHHGWACGCCAVVGAGGQSFPGSDVQTSPARRFCRPASSPALANFPGI